MAVERLNIQEIPIKRSKIPDKIPNPPARIPEIERDYKPPSPPKSRDTVILGVFQAIGIVLAIRLFLFLSLIGTFVLAVIATHDKDAMSLGVMVAYSLLTTVPLAILEWRGKKGGG